MWGLVADHAVLVGEDDQLGPIPDIQATEQARDVTLHRRRGEVHLFSDFIVAQALGDQLEQGQVLLREFLDLFGGAVSALVAR